MFPRRPSQPTVAAGTVFRFDNGDELCDRISGFTGIVVARTEWFNGCVRYSLQSSKLKDCGQTQEVLTFDDEQLDLVAKAKVVPAHRERALAAQRQQQSYTHTGGPPISAQRGAATAPRPTVTR